MKRDTLTYMSQAMKDRLVSPEYSLAIYRDPETVHKEEVMNDFLEHVEKEFEMSQDDMSDLEALVSSFLGYDIKKVEQAEQTLLQNWNNLIKGEN